MLEGLCVGKGEGAGDGGLVGDEVGFAEIVGELVVGLTVGLAVGLRVGALVHRPQAFGHSSDTRDPLIVSPHQSAIRTAVLLGLVVIQAQSLVVVTPLYA